MSGKRAKALRREFRKTDAVTKNLYQSGDGSIRGNNWRAFKRAAQ